MDAGLGGWLGTIIIGGLAGWVASKVMKTDAQMGVLANVIVGVLGALLANLLLPVLGFSGTSDSSGYITKFVVAFLGAMLLLFVVSLFRKRA